MPLHRSLCWMMAALLSACATHFVYATDATVVGDASVSMQHPNVNYGRGPYLFVGNGFVSLVEFDLSSLPAGTQASKVAKATVKLYVDQVTGSGSVSVFPVTSAWTENAVSYNTMPTLGAALASFTPALSENFVVLDITALVQSWITDPASSHGIALKHSTGFVAIDSKENQETSHVAHLDITLVSQGPAGPIGPQGPAGPAGPPGPQGPVGPAGAPGATGPQGPPVSFMSTWNNATTYAIGDAVSEDGSSYIALAPSTGTDPAVDVASSGGHWAVLAQKGDTGAVGATGPQGPIGPIGPQGPIGLTGPQGPEGPAGATGPQGPAGPQGTTGSAGPQGPPVTFRSAWNVATTYAIGDAVSEGGSSYIALASNAGIDPATDVASNGGNWAVLAAQGGAGTVSVGTTTTGAYGTSARVTNSGTSSAAVLNFVIPQGEPGPAGPAGPTGPAGATGPQGPSGTVPASFLMLTSIFSNGNDNGADLYFSPIATAENNGATGIEFSGGADNEMVVPLSCTLGQLSFAALLTATGSSAQTSTITVYHGTGVTTPAATALTCTTNQMANVAGSVGTCSDTSNTVSLRAGDTLSLRLHETNDTVTSPIVQYSAHLVCQ